MSAEPADGRAIARFLGDHDRTFLSRVEDAGLNASAPTQQRWMDGWIVRTCPGKAQRARCINAVAPGRRPVAEKLAECVDLYAALALPLLVRITPFTQPAGLDASLQARGFAFHDDTRVMVLPDLATAALEPSASGTAVLAGADWVELAPVPFAEAVGALRGSSPEARRAHAERLRSSPVPYRGFALVRAGAVLCCGQVALEGPLAGLYDIATADRQQKLGLGTWLCKRMLTYSMGERGAKSAYLQVGADNHAARRIYARLGFTDGYSYHYRAAPAAR